MATGHVHQFIETISVPRDPLLTYVVSNRNLSKKDLRVFLLLLTKLNGVNNKKAQDYETAVEYGDDEEGEREASKVDNWIPLSPKQIAEELHMDKTDVKESIDHLLMDGILQVGTSKTVKKGYRFCF